MNQVLMIRQLKNLVLSIYLQMRDVLEHEVLIVSKMIHRRINLKVNDCGMYPTMIAGTTSSGDRLSRR